MGDAGGGECSRPAATRRRREDRATAPIAASVPVAWVLSPAVRSHDHQRLKRSAISTWKQRPARGPRTSTVEPRQIARAADERRRLWVGRRCHRPVAGRARRQSEPAARGEQREGHFSTLMTDQPRGVRTTRIGERGRSRCAIGRTVPGWTHRGDDCWLSTMTGRTPAGGRGAPGVAFRWWSRRHKRSE